MMETLGLRKTCTFGSQINHFSEDIYLLTWETRPPCFKIDFGNSYIYRVIRVHTKNLYWLVKKILGEKTKTIEKRLKLLLLLLLDISNIEISLEIFLLLFLEMSSISYYVWWLKIGGIFRPFVGWYMWFCCVFWHNVLDIWIIWKKSILYSTIFITSGIEVKI